MIINNKVRDYLIRAARQKDKFVYYSDVVKDCGLDINTNTEYGRKQLSDILGEIAEFEDNQTPPRPLLSSLAIYKDKNKNDHGDGFYKIAARLGKGSFKQLKEDLYGFTEAERSRVFWKNEENFNKYASINKKVKKNIYDLFIELTNQEFEWVEKWKTEYIKFTKGIKMLQKNIQKYPEKRLNDNDLYIDLPESMQSYDGFMRKWLKEKANGISSRGQSVLSDDNYGRIIVDDTFKIIAKAVIQNPNLENYNALRNWWHGNPAINNRPLLINRAIAACNPEELSSTVDGPKFWFVTNILKHEYGFEFTRELECNWFYANTQLTRWLDNELMGVLTRKTSDKLEQIILRNIFVWLIYEEFNSETIVPSNTLSKKDIPFNGFDQIPETSKDFKAVNIDYEKKQREMKDLGDAGEALVMQYEIDFLREKGLHEESNQVRIVNDGEGYDVFSFDEFGKEKYIEVKTTTGNNLSPFCMSENEISFMRIHSENYCIYRVYNYNEENNSGYFFELKDNVEDQILMKPTQFQILVKKLDNTFRTDMASS